MTSAKTTRGKIVMVASQKSQTHANMKKTYYVEFTIAKAVNVKNGVVMTYQLPNDARKWEPVKGLQNVLVIQDPTLQAAAHKLYEKAEQGELIRFFNIDDAKAAIVALV